MICLAFSLRESYRNIKSYTDCSGLQDSEGKNFHHFIQRLQDSEGKNFHHFIQRLQADKCKNSHDQSKDYKLTNAKITAR